MELLPLAPNTPHFHAALRLYEAIHGERPASTEPRFRAHADHTGYRGFVALDGQEVVGFTYGHDSKAGRDYHDQLHADMPRSVATEWLTDTFELVELGVAPDRRRTGLGTRLVDRLLEGVTRRRVILTTESDNHAAQSFYEQTGWEAVHEPFVVSGVDMTVYGRRLA
ncbi:GNAT family N-acetyltransferase [Halosegnis longus]|uniref:GNAT family N-acetyltransferase n=1 Tax=Halosegnis longus TaxID=2216012 RepID=UPI00096A5BE2|nr:GNAT family N-acetyltransferase [Salella cibi]